MRFKLSTLSFALILAISACTDFQEDDSIPSGLSVGTEKLSFSEDASTHTVIVKSGSKWSINSIPEWIQVQSIENQSAFRYEWPVTFSAQSNSGYNRKGTISIGTADESIAISVEQKGKKGAYVAVESVSINKDEMTLTKGESQKLTASIRPSSASEKSVIWSSSNTAVATVSSDGIVTAIEVGSATISVTTDDGNKTATCTVTVTPVTVNGVSLNKTTLSLIVGDSETLTATVSPSNAANKNVTWSSSNTNVATVDSNGIVTAIAVGSATITVTSDDGDKAATCSVTVNPVTVTGISLSQSNITLTVGDTQTLTATISPSNATDKSVTWTSSNTSVATVSSDGVVIAKSAGTATITVITNDGGKNATCSVTVQDKTIVVTGISLDMTSLSMIIGETQLLKATITPTNATDKSVFWSSNNTNIATVSSSGLVTAKMVGAAVITASTKDGAKTATCSISVGYAIPTAVDLGLSIKWASFNIGAAKPEDTGYYFPWGETEPVAFSYGDFFFFPLEGYKWYHDRNLTKYCPIANYGQNGYTDNKTILDQNDDAAFVNLGTTWRMPTNEEFAQLKDKCTWKWTSTNGVSGYKVTGPNGNSIFLPAAGFGTMMEFRNGGTQGYYWTSSLRTDYPYYAYSFSFGSSSFENESRDRSSILPIRPVTGTPLVSVTGVSLNKSSLSMTVGDTQTLTATVTPSNATDKSVTWSSDNTSVATVSDSGVVTAKKAGTATITVTTLDGSKTATCAVTVNAVTIPVTSIAFAQSSISVRIDSSIDLNPLVTVLPENATDKSFSISLLDDYGHPNRTIKLQDGVVTPMLVGTATVMVVSNSNPNVKATCTITVVPINVTGVSLDMTNLILTEGQTQTLTATITPLSATDKSVTWTSSNNSVADVSSSGVVTAKAAGTTTITVKTVDGGKTATCSVTVKSKVINVTGVSLDKTSLTLTEGDTQTLIATVSPSNATDKSVTWTSNNTSVATVSSSGVVTAKAAGSATITVKTTDGSKTATCSVTVKSKDVNGSGNEGTGEGELF